MSDQIFILVSSSLADRNFLSSNRFESLWRALCHLGQVVRLEIDAKDNPLWQGVSQAELNAHLARLCAGDPNARLIFAGDLATRVALAVLPEGARAILAPAHPRPEHLLPGHELWLRSNAERQLIRDREQTEADRAADVQIIPDVFKPIPLPRATAEAFVGLIVEAPVAAEDLEWLRQCIRNDPDVVYMATHETLRLLDPDPTIRVVRRPDVASVLVDTQTLYLIGSPASLALLRATAIVSERQLRLPTGAAGAENDPGFDPEACQAAVASALGVLEPPTPEVLATRLRNNLALSFSVHLATFQPWSRLVHVVLNAPGAYPEELLSGYFDSSGMAENDLVNAQIQPTDPHGTDAGSSLRATAALAPGVLPERIDIVLTAWGAEVWRMNLAAGLAIESAGLISIEHLDETHVQINAWGRPGELEIQVGRRVGKAVQEVVNNNGCAGFRQDADWPFNRETLTPLPKEGTALRFSAFKRVYTPRRLASRRLEQMRDAYAGRSAWMVGNGPSVQLEDMDRLAETNQLCFAFNRFHLAYDQTALRPHFTVTGDAQMIEDFGQQIVDSAGGTVCVAHGRAPALTGDYIWLRQVSAYPSLFSHEPARWVTPGGSSLYVALQIGYWLGIRRWYLYGADFAFRFNRRQNGQDAFRSASGDDNHFIKNYRSGRAWCPPAIESILPAFHMARMQMELAGGYILNATRGGFLHVFDRVEFDEALRN